MKNLFILLSIVMLTLSSCKDECANTVCENDGICVDGTCICPTGYSGENCELFDPCSTLLCGDNGTCEDGSCECEKGYEGENCQNTVATKFLGTYDIVCNGSLDIDGTMEDFVNEPGTARIYQGEDPDEIVLYVQLDLVTDVFPMTVESFGEVDELEYDTDTEPQRINANIGGIITIEYDFAVRAQGELSEDYEELESTVTFSGDLTGIITCTGEKQ